VSLFDRRGRHALRLEGRNVHFDPGSAALKILDSETGRARPPVTADLVAFSRLTDSLQYIAAQSTGLVSSDVPGEISDRYRLYVALLNSSKPVVTGTFTTGGFAVMREMLEAVAGGDDALRKTPRAIFDACASQPLKWSRLTTQSLLDCARSGIPAELISVPLLGATAPATLTGALVQHSAENLSGLVIHQVAGPGSPLIYGGSPAVFDMRHGTVALGAAESMMLCCGYAQIGRYLGIPTHGYLGLSDSKVVDAQAGLESGIGAVMAALGGINVVSGAGMLEFENCQCLEKLVIDNEACGMALRFVDGIQPRGERLAEDLFGDLSEGDHFLTSPVTLKWLRKEVLLPSSVIDREPAETSNRRTVVERARERVVSLLAKAQPDPIPDELRDQLTGIMYSDARRHGLDRLPG
jgi:trimethylamine--corrinoid protein Co-methyltransferase